MTNHREISIAQQGNRFPVRMPNKCIYCGAPSDILFPIKAEKTRGKRKTVYTWKVPYCAEHLALRKEYERKLGMGGFHFIIFIIMLIISSLILGNFEFDIALKLVANIGLAYVGATFVRHLRRGKMVEKEPALGDMLSYRYLGIDAYVLGNTAKFTFTNPEIATEFETLNQAFVTSAVDTQKKEMIVTEDYRKWRKVIFSITPDQVEAPKDQPDHVYGVLMDIGMVDKQSGGFFALSVTAFPTGETSFRPTLGGGTVGLGGDEKMSKIAKGLVSIAQTLLDKSQPTKDFSLPETEFVKFFFLTTDGVRVYTEHLSTMQTQGNPFNQMLAGFGAIRQFAEGITDKQLAEK